MGKFVPDLTNALDYKDVFIVPQYTAVSSRKMVDVSSVFDSKQCKMALDVPVLSANMDSISGYEMCNAMRTAGGAGALHRFMSIEENVKQFQKVDSFCFVSVGVNEESKERAKELYKAGARFFIVDIAHGDSVMMQKMICWLRDQFNHSIYIVGGNVATPQGVMNLVNWGCNAIKVGVGPGHVCLTKNVTGVTVPPFTATMLCVGEKQKLEQLYSRPIPLISDGGLREIGDIAKALGVGADFVMCGSMFAGALETPGAIENGYKVYRGMATREALESKNRALNIKQHQLPTPEGKSTMVECKGPVGDIVQHIKGGLQSSFSYANSRSIKEFQGNCKFGTRKQR